MDEEEGLLSRSSERESQDGYVLTPSDNAELRRMFEVADEDRSGYLDTKELRSALGSWTKARASVDVPALMREFDVDRSGTIDFDEFLEMARTVIERDIFLVPEKEERPSSRRRRRMLALHGRGDNAQVTRLQLKNLGLADRFDLVVAEGPFETTASNEDELVDGPFFTWVGPSPRATAAGISKVIGEAIDKDGPFDGVFGFSLGGAVALALFQPDVLRVLDQNHHYGLSTTNTQKRMDSTANTSRFSFGNTASTPQHQHSSSWSRTNSSGDPPFKFAVVACPSSVASVRASLGINPLVPSLNEKVGSPGNECRTVHIVGTRDSLKPDAENNVLEQCFHCGDNVLVKYLPIGHELPRTLRNDTHLVDVVSSHVEENPVVYSRLAKKDEAAAFAAGATATTVKMSEYATAKIDKSRQLVTVDLTPPPQAKSFVSAIGSADPESVYIRGLRSGGQKKGPVEVTFEDLRYLVVEELEDMRSVLGLEDQRGVSATSPPTIAYSTPPDGPSSAVAACAFFVFASLGAAAPLEASTSEHDAADAFDQLAAATVVVWRGGEEEGMRQAAVKVGARLFEATFRSRRPLEFFFEDVYLPDAHFDSLAVRYRRKPNHHERERPQSSSKEAADESRVALLLRTSGTTSKPKIVALAEEQVVTNGFALASNLDLTQDDVCLNAMPLFHIGGLSASVLGTLGAKASATFIAGPFAAEVFAKHLGFPPDDPANGGVRPSEATSLSSSPDDSSLRETYSRRRSGDHSSSLYALSPIDVAVDWPLPTWYSAVPTMHNAVVAYLSKFKDSPRVYHRLRFVRSGAAALSPYDARQLSTIFGGVPVITTYSMSEQMPISQPPLAYGRRQLDDKPGTVGVAVATSLAIVGDSLEPIVDDFVTPMTPYTRSASTTSVVVGLNGMSVGSVKSRRLQQQLGSRKSGQIAITGPTVMAEYLNNPGANASSFFLLDGRRWFLTGDVGCLDEDGHLRLTGRSKELIKRGGEQVSPYEIEEILAESSLIDAAVAFAVPSALWGEEVGVAIVPTQPEKISRDDKKAWARVVRDACNECDLSPHKIPTHVVVVDDSQLPKTKTRKYIRLNLAKELLGITPVGSEGGGGDFEEASTAASHRGPPNVSAALSGARFVLVLWTMFQHIGSGRSFGKWKQTRGFNLHMPMFFALAGFQLASGMAPPPQDLYFLSKSHRRYFFARVSAVHPLYLLSIVCCALVLLIGCRPDTYRQDFHWEANKDYDRFGIWRWSESEDDDGDIRSHAFCEPTPLDMGSWFGTYVTTIVVYALGLQAWPFAIFISWFLSFYTWFQSVYYFCLFVFPWVYRSLYRIRGDKERLAKAMCVAFVGNLAVCAIYLTLFMDWARHYRHKAPLTLILYLFPPFWAPHFFAGTISAFLLDCYRPKRVKARRAWARIGDGLSLYFLVAFFALRITRESLRPPAANNSTFYARIWAFTFSRLHFPFVIAWIFALAVGEGFVAKFLATDFLAKTLGPLSFAAYLFHQVVGALYYAATRNAVWNWWRFRKQFYWFSPYPVPVPWYEAFWVMTLTVFASKFLTDTVNPVLVGVWNSAARHLTRLGASSDSKHVDTLETVCDVIFQLTGTEVQPENTLEQCGLASVGLPVLIKMLTSAIPGLTMTAADFVSAQTLKELADNIDARIAHNEAAHIM